MVAAGRVSGLFGAKGGVSLVLFDTFPHDFNMEEPVFVVIDEHTVPLFFDHFARRGRKGATASFADIDTEQRATELVGLSFSIRTRKADDTLVGAGPDDDELYFEELVGWEAETGDGCKGRITAFFEDDFNPLLELELDGATELIPAQDEFIVELDEEGRKVIFELPEGLLGLNNK